MFKYLESFLLAAFGLVGVVCVAFVFNFSETENRFERMYAFAGDDYSKARYLLQAHGLPPYLTPFYPRGAVLYSEVLSKDVLSKFGYGESCGVFEYIDVFGDLAVNRLYDSECCDSTFMGLSSIVVDQKSDRYLLMCGVGYSSYVLGVSKTVLDSLVKDFYSAENFNVRM